MRKPACNLRRRQLTQSQRGLRYANASLLQPSHDKRRYRPRVSINNGLLRRFLTERHSNRQPRPAHCRTGNLSMGNSQNKFAPRSTNSRNSCPSGLNRVTTASLSLALSVREKNQPLHVDREEHCFKKCCSSKHRSTTRTQLYPAIQTELPTQTEDSHEDPSLSLCRR
jgi:hypothetical protein